MEKELAAVWSAVLGVAQVGVDDDFFDLGGHSPLATQVVSRVRGLHGVQVPLEDFFENATVARLAALVERLRGGGEPAGDAAEPQAVGDLLAQIDTLPEEDLDALLESMLSPSGKL